MSRLVWGEPGKRFYETGVDRGVFYPVKGVGVPWNGLMAVSEAPSGEDLSEGYYDGEKFRQQRMGESFSAKLAAFSYPKEFEEYDGLTSIGHAQQKRKMFRLSYRTRVGNAEDPNATYKIHLLYNAVASPSIRSFNSLGSNVNSAPFEWQIDTIPEILSTGEFSAHLIVDETLAYPWAIAALEDILYGSVSSDPRFPEIQEVIDLFENASILRITDNGDGTWTADGPEWAIQMLDADTFEITWPSAVYIDTDTYRISSL